MNKNNGQNNQHIFTGVIWGTVVGMICILIGTLIITLLLSNETIQPETVSYSVMIISIISTLIGSLVAVFSIGKYNLLGSLSVGVAMFLILISINAVFFDGQFNGVFPTLLVILGSSIVAFLLGSRVVNGKQTPRKKRRMVNLYKK